MHLAAGSSFPSLPYSRSISLETGPSACTWPEIGKVSILPNRMLLRWCKPHTHAEHHYIPSSFGKVESRILSRNQSYALRESCKDQSHATNNEQINTSGRLGNKSCKATEATLTTGAPHSGRIPGTEPLPPRLPHDATEVDDRPAGNTEKL